MSEGPPPSAARPRGLPHRGIPTARLLLLLALLGHASLVVADVLPAPAWLPVVECVAACLLGLRYLRAIDAGDVAAPDAPPPAGRASASTPPLPARIAGGLDQPAGPSAGT